VGEKLEAAANLVPPQSVEAELAAPPQEEVATPDSAPAFDLALRIPPPAHLTGMQPRAEEFHQQATPMKKKTLLTAAQLAVDATLSNV
jgi:hypothetical protein